jgi:hypothetical protein
MNNLHARNKQTHKQAVLQALLWVVHRLPNHDAPTFQVAVSVLQMFCEVRGACVLCVCGGDGRMHMRMRFVARQ